MRPTVRDAATAELDPVTLYALLRLRVDVFVVEQQCPYPELDGRDLEADARQLWVEQDGSIVATLRLLRDPDGTARIGRVATATSARGAGHAAALMQRAVDIVGQDVPLVLDAQSHLVDWYGRFGFVPTGPEYLEDGIPHVPMRKEPEQV